MKLQIASLFTLILLSGFLLSILLTIAYFFGYINAYSLLILTVVINFVLWLISPWISDFIYKIFYKIQWYDFDEFKKKYPQTATMIKNVCDKYRFKIPKLGIIPDDNPNAFTYGSGRWNARLVATEGIYKYLDVNEANAVYAHELGHIKNQDFIIMTIASTIVQLLYEIYVITVRTEKKDSDSDKKGNALALIGLISYIFYWIGTYVVLFLSRLREYYADEFAAKETGNPNYLISALIKIAYGIIVNPDDHRSSRLMQSTRSMGITDFKVAKGVGLAYYNSKKANNFLPFKKMLTFDLVNPWAFIAELSSTHPLTGKRIRRLSQMEENKKPLFDFSDLGVSIDKNKLYGGFFKDLMFVILPWSLVVLVPFVLFLSFFVSTFTGQTSLFVRLITATNLLTILGIAVGLFIAGKIASVLYKYSSKEPEKTTVIDLMSDIYASPVRGHSVKLKGKIIGKGIPGLIYSEDMMLQDETGLMYLNYQSGIPLIGNLIFGLTKVDKMIGQQVTINGWFLRQMFPWVDMNNIETNEGVIKSYVKFWAIISPILLVGVIALIIFLI